METIITVGVSLVAVASVLGLVLGLMLSVLDEEYEDGT